ncbi:hypothetical protein FHG87_019068 [Trinorchestia longiramus]|nr:hypothetical protein FHG87_019068 [Trinorchestia longiramus]
MVIHKLTTTAADLEPGTSRIASEFAHQLTKLVTPSTTTTTSTILTPSIPWCTSTDKIIIKFCNWLSNVH